MNLLRAATCLLESAALLPLCLKTPIIRGLESGGMTITLGPKVRPRRSNMSGSTQLELLKSKTKTTPFGKASANISTRLALHISPPSDGKAR
ncbi:MAG: hypothetical protein ACTS4U_01130 [Candidatus Hodgkinia cicadicola]